MRRLLLAIVVMFPAWSASAAMCDNNGRCTEMGNQSTPTHSARKSQRQHHRHAVASKPTDANANTATQLGYVISHKTGARARVGVAHAATFQAYVDDLETNYGAKITFMGGTRPGRCSSAHQHPCGRAIDLCQRRRGVVDSKCNLPGRRSLATIAARHGLFEGGRWCNSDYGHAQVGETAPDCGSRVASMRRRDRSTITISAH